MTNKLIKYLEWDSDFFGLKIGRACTSNFEASTAESTVLEAKVEHYDCVYALVDAKEAHSIRNAEESGFRYADIRLTYAISEQSLASPTATSAYIRPASENDLSRLRSLASNNHLDTRFYRDGGFPKAKCDNMYAAWIEKTYSDQHSAIFVSEIQNQAAGYICCTKSADSGNIGLIGVAPEYTGKGIGQSLIDKSLRWFTEHGCKTIDVITQGNNIAAQKLYQKCGFRSQNIQIWLHLWPKKSRD